MVIREINRGSRFSDHFFEKPSNISNYQCSLELKGQGGEHSVKCANICDMHMSIHTYGYSGNLTFVVDEEDYDKINFFYEPPIIEITLKVEPLSPEDPVTPFEFKGIVTTKSIKEVRNGIDSDYVVKKECTIQFCDPAAAIWSNHFPIGIYTEKSMEDVINEFISTSISIKFDFPPVQEVRPLIAIGLGNSDVSFYTFLMWYLKKEKGIWDYDYKEHQYVIRGEKENPTEKIELPFDEGELLIFWSDIPRHDMRVVNSFTEAPESKEVKGVEVHENISRDIFFPTPIPGEVEKKAEEIKPEPHTREHQLQIDFQSYPVKELFPGNLFIFKNPYWGKDFYFKEKTYRLHTLKLEVCGAENSYTTVPSDERSFTGSLVGIFELEEEVEVRRPAIKEPLYPFALEAKIFSEKGEEKEITFDIGKDDETSQYYYTVEIPWAEKQKVKAPFQPTYTNGQTYNPLLKGQRVVVHFDLYTAEIVEVKDWNEFVEIQQKEIQGNRTLFAPWEEGKQYTIMEHVKEDDGTLTFLIQRRSDKQVQLIRIKEDGLHIIVQEEGNEEPQCHMWMDNESTTTLTTKKDDKVQTIVMKPEEISTTCESGGDKSTIVQTPTSISIECDEFSLKTKSTNFTSDSETICEGKTLDFSGKQGITIEDGAKVGISASSITIG